MFFMIGSFIHACFHPQLSETNILNESNLFEERGRTLLSSHGGHLRVTLLVLFFSMWSRLDLGSRPRSSGNAWTFYVFLRVLLPYQMRQHANNTRQERSMSCAYQKFRVHRHLELRVLSTSARVQHIGSGRNPLEFSLDH